MMTFDQATSQWIEHGDGRKEVDPEINDVCVACDDLVDECGFDWPLTETVDRIVTYLQSTDYVMGARSIAVVRAGVLEWKQRRNGK